MVLATRRITAGLAAIFGMIGTANAWVYCELMSVYPQARWLCEASFEGTATNTGWSGHFMTLTIVQPNMHWARYAKCTNTSTQPARWIDYYYLTGGSYIIETVEGFNCGLAT
jgi:hypothetical protein